ncbi:MAG TPA: hypothetical protein VJ625_17250 [Propionibacteriaceae bacterium]|nr:hypothetical protein [Propionibacteriaceae bacterium]
MTPPETHKQWVGTSWKMNKALVEADNFPDKLLTPPIPGEIQPFLDKVTPVMAMIFSRTLPWTATAALL